MKKLLMGAIMASGLMFASCQGDQNNQNTESRGDDINDEIGGPEDNINSDVQGDDRLGGEAIGTEDDTLYLDEEENMDMDNDTTQMQQQDQYQ